MEINRISKYCYMIYTNKLFLVDYSNIGGGGEIIWKSSVIEKFFFFYQNT